MWKKSWKTHFEDLPNAAAFAAKAAEKTQGCRKMEDVKHATMRKKRLCGNDEGIGGIPRWNKVEQNG